MQLDGETVVGVKPGDGVPPPLHREARRGPDLRPGRHPDGPDGLPLADDDNQGTRWRSRSWLAWKCRARRVHPGDRLGAEPIASHQVAIGTFGADVGTWFTPLVYCFREREEILDLFMLCAGVR